MTDDVETAEPVEYDIEKYGAPYGTYDSTLALYLMVAQGRHNEGGSSIGITLLVEGAVITGLVVSEEAWFTSLEESASGQEVAPLFTALKDSRTLVRDTFREMIDEAAETGNTPTPKEICMKDVRISFGGVIHAMSLWRVSLSKVSAWSPLNL